MSLTINSKLVAAGILLASVFSFLLNRLTADNTDADFWALAVLRLCLFAILVFGGILEYRRSKKLTVIKTLASAALIAVLFAGLTYYLLGGYYH